MLAHYDAWPPETAPFVAAGRSVVPGDVLCIIESMQIMNKVEAEVTGLVAGKLVENGEHIEYGRNLFLIVPEHL
jgi:acetyl-CoA carboxylase biotin carboxyl carrier protein